MSSRNTARSIRNNAGNHRATTRLPRSLLLVAALAPLALSLHAASALAQHEAAPGPRIVESPAALEVTTVITCPCGGCVNQTLHDCTCGFAAGERQRIDEALKAGETPDAIIAAYVAQHGAQIRIVPEKTGLNLIGWAVPFIAAATGVVALTFLLLAWRRRTADLQTVPPLADADRHYRDRLDRDLKELD